MREMDGFVKPKLKNRELQGVTRSYKEDKYSRRPYDPYEGVPKETQTRRDKAYNPGSTLSSRVLNCSTESLLTTSEGSAFQRLQIL